MERKKVVLSDDVELFLVLEDTFFNRDDFEIITARSGQELLRIIKSSNPLMAFVSLEMPQLSGDECCRILKEDEEFRDMPVVIVVPSGAAREMDRCRLSGCDGVVAKPIDRRTFLETSQRFLNVRERVEKRSPLQVAVTYAAIAGDLHKDYTINLNRGGMFLSTDRLMEVGTRLYLDFALPGVENPIRCLASVAWVNGPVKLKKPSLPNGMGLRFLNLSDADIKAISRLMEEEAPEEMERSKS